MHIDDVSSDDNGQDLRWCCGGVVGDVVWYVVVLWCCGGVELLSWWCFGRCGMVCGVVVVLLWWCGVVVVVVLSLCFGGV